MMDSSNQVDQIEIDKRVYIEVSKTKFKYFYSRVNDFELEIDMSNIKKLIFFSSNVEKRNKKFSGCNIISFLFFNIFNASNYTRNGGMPKGDNPGSNYNELIVKYSDSINAKDEWNSKHISWPRLTKSKVDKIFELVLSYNKEVITKYYL